MLLVVCTREKPKLGGSSEGRGAFRVCLGPVVREPPGVSEEQDSVLAP